MRVQISPSTQLALQAAGGFIIEFRGHVNIKVSVFFTVNTFILNCSYTTLSCELPNYLYI